MTEQAQSAAQQLAQYEQMWDNDAALRPSRGYWHLMLWSAVFAAAYLAVFLFSFGAVSEEQITSQPGGYQVSWLLITPVLAFCALNNGARERFAVRTTYSWMHWILFGLIIAGFMTLGVLWFSDIGYPWWLNVVLPLLLFIAMAAGPIRGLRSTPRRGIGSWGNAPLSRSVRLTTVVLGLVLGVLLAVSTHRLAAVLVFLAGMVYLTVQLVAWNSRFGLSRAGYAWGPLHWGSFGACAAIMFVSVLLRVHTSVPIAALCLVAGTLVAVIMSVAAVLPRHSPLGRT